MSLQSLESSILLSNFKNLVQQERRISREVLEHIAEIEKRRLYADEGFSSSHDWLVSRHGYSHAAASRRVSAAKMLNAVPEAAVKIETGGLCMTTLSRVQSAIRFEERRTGSSMTLERKAEVINEVETKPKSQIERALAEIFQAPAPRREILQAKYNGETRTHLTLSAEQMQKIERAAEILSHKLERGEGLSLARLIEAMADMVIAKKDPLVRIVRRRSKMNRNENDTRQSRCGVESDEGSGIVQSAPSERSKSIPARTKQISPAIRNEIYRRDASQCQFETRDGVKCLSRRFVQIDHIVPRALGGSNEPENLRVLCRTHNLLMAERVFGKETVLAARIPGNRPWQG